MPMLASDEALSAAVLDALDAGVILLDSAQRVVSWNVWMVAAAGVGREQAIGQSLEQIFPTSSLKRLNAAVRDAFETGASSLLTHSLHPRLFPLETRAGGELVHTVLVKPVGEKPYARCLVQVRDVTAAASRERVLRERQNARYDAVVETAPDAIFTIDADGFVQMANPSAARQLGYSQEDLVGRPLEEHFEDRAAWQEIWRSVLAGENRTQPSELTVRRGDGSRSFAGVTAARWISHSRVFVTAILRDVNARRIAEDALRRLNETLEQRVADRTAERDRIWRLSRDLMLVARPDGVLSAVNPAAVNVLGDHDAQVVGEKLQAFVAEEDRPILASALEELAGPAATKRFTLRMIAKDGSPRLVEWSAVSVDGILHAVGRDVTAERAAAEALRQAEEALRQSRKMEAIGQLTGGIAHDFNNLLTGIIGSMDVLKRRIQEGRFEDTQRFMDAAVTSANRAASLTHRLLAFARRQPLDPRPIDPNRLVRGMEELLRRSLGEKVELIIQLEPELWASRADAHQLENAILNLAINGRDAMPGGGELTISSRNVVIAEGDGRGEIRPGEYVLISVADTGMGMPPEVLSKVFEPFFTTKPLGKGTGLGLSTIYGFAQQSGGRVQIRSAVGAGTQVELYLPRFAGSVQPDLPQEAPELPKGHGETVLLVEDDPAVRLLIGEVLRDLGYASIEAHDGLAAVPMLASNIRLDLMITDVGLPGLDGRQLAELARRHRPDLRVLFVTGYAERVAGWEGFIDERMAMIRKPFSLDALALKINEIIRA